MATNTFEMLVKVRFWIGGMGAFSTHFLSFSWHSACVYFGAFLAFLSAASFACSIFSSFFFCALNVKITPYFDLIPNLYSLTTNNIYKRIFSEYVNLILTQWYLYYLTDVVEDAAYVHIVAKNDLCIYPSWTLICLEGLSNAGHSPYQQSSEPPSGMSPNTVNNDDGLQTQ